MFDNFFFRNSSRLWDNVENYGNSKQATENDTAHTFCVLDKKKSYRHTLRICKAYCLSAVTMVARKRINVTFIGTLPVWLWRKLLFWCAVMKSGSNFANNGSPVYRITGGWAGYLCYWQRPQFYLHFYKEVKFYIFWTVHCDISM
jgi:hypothetical protein